MPTFTTPTPIDLAINLPVGVDRGRRQRPRRHRRDGVAHEPAKAVDRRGAEETKVDFDGERVTIMGPEPRLSFVGPTESVDVKVELPTGSRLTAEISVGGVRTVGRLGATRVKSSMGPSTSTPPATCGCARRTATSPSARADGGARDHGRPRPDPRRHRHRRRDPQGVARLSPDRRVRRRPRGEAVLRRPRDHDSALGSVAAKTAYGSIQLHEVSSGSVQVESGFGQVTIGVRPGVPAWLDLSSKNGRVRNELDGDRAPGRRPSSPSPCARAPSSATSPSSAPDRPHRPKGNTMTTALRSACRAREVLQDAARPARRRLRRGAGQHLRPARLQRRRQDHDRAGSCPRCSRPDAGTATVNGYDVATQPAEVRESISLTGQFAAVDEILTGRENLVLVAQLRHLRTPARSRTSCSSGSS